MYRVLVSGGSPTWSWRARLSSLNSRNRARVSPSWSTTSSSERIQSIVSCSSMSGSWCLNSSKYISERRLGHGHAGSTRRVVARTSSTSMLCSEYERRYFARRPSLQASIDAGSVAGTSWTGTAGRRRGPRPSRGRTVASRYQRASGPFDGADVDRAVVLRDPDDGAVARPGRGARLDLDLLRRGQRREVGFPERHLRTLIEVAPALGDGRLRAGRVDRRMPATAQCWTLGPVCSP